MTLSSKIVQAGRSASLHIPALRRLKNSRAVNSVWSRWADSFPLMTDYATYLSQRLAQRRRKQTVKQIPGLLSFVTTVYDTDVVFVRHLAESVFSQDGGTNFEWLILDNGSKKPQTIEYLKTLAKEPCVRLARVEQNLGIIGGMRWCAERATGRYILPLDSDDYIVPDAVNVITQHIVTRNFPPLLYSDEDKLRDGRQCDPYFKPDWDPILFAHSCYIAHLCAIEREKALSLSCYTDVVVEGSHDWDTFTRFAHGGHRPEHIPEILYSWRMHSLSTAQNIQSKPYIFESQKRVVQHWIDGSSRPQMYAVEKSPLFGGGPDWRIVRRHAAARPLINVTFSETPETPQPDLQIGEYPISGRVTLPRAAPITALEDIAKTAARSGALVHLLWDQVSHIDATDWAWEALTLTEVWAETVMVGGRIFGPDGRLVAGGAYFGFGRGCDCPDKGRYASDPGYFAQMWKPRSVSAVSAQHAVVDSAFLAYAVQRLRDQPVSIPYLGAWLGAVAREVGRRVAYSPFLSGRATSDWDDLVSGNERRAFNRFAAPYVPETALLSPRLGLTPESAYLPVADSMNLSHVRSMPRSG
jgi:O-antigen biosynthesis protein